MKKLPLLLALLQDGLKAEVYMSKSLENILWLLFAAFLIVCTASIDEIFNIGSLFSRDMEAVHLFCLVIIGSIYCFITIGIKQSFLDYKLSGSLNNKRRYYIVSQNSKIYYVFLILYISVSMYLIYYGFFIVQDVIEIIGTVFAFYFLFKIILKIEDWSNN